MPRPNLLYIEQQRQDAEWALSKLDLYATPVYQQDLETSLENITVLLAYIKELEDENARLSDRVEDYEDDIRQVMSQMCTAPDEKHCACVAPLRTAVGRLLDLVKRLQWGQGALCPLCAGGAPEGHQADCPVIKVLGGVA